VSTLRAVLFDLDGTLLDTAPDMVGALDLLRAEQGLGPVDYELARAHVSNGALGLINIAFSDLDEDRRMDLRDRYLALYESRLATATQLFDGMSDVLDSLEQQDMRWGVVTNKPAFLTEPLLAALDLLGRCACVVSGDTLPERKPHPGPLLHAAAIMGMNSGQAMYVGDSDRDIAAGKAAGMTTVAAAYGFVPPGDDPDRWAADHKIRHPSELLVILNDYA
jgi:2-phosphoglycolate phosphatase